MNLLHCTNEADESSAVGASKIFPSLPYAPTRKNFANESAMPATVWGPVDISSFASAGCLQAVDSLRLFQLYCTAEGQEDHLQDSEVWL